MTRADDHVVVALRVGGILDAIGVRHTIGGSIAASFAGEPRSTVDIDFVVALTHDDIEPLVAALGSEFYVVEEALRRAIDTFGSANVIHHGDTARLSSRMVRWRRPRRFVVAVVASNSLIGDQHSTHQISSAVGP